MKTSPGRPDAPGRAILVRRQRIGIGDVSRTGCRLEGGELLAIGAVGMLSVEIDGRRHVEMFRVARSGALSGPHRLFEAGVEFLPMPSHTASLHNLIAQLDQLGQSDTL